MIVVVMVIVTSMFWTATMCQEFHILFTFISHNAVRLLLCPFCKRRKWNSENFIILSKDTQIVNNGAKLLFDEASILSMTPQSCMKPAKAKMEEEERDKSIHTCLRDLEEKSLLQSRFGPSGHCGRVGCIQGFFPSEYFFAVLFIFRFILPMMNSRGTVFRSHLK